LLKVLEPGRSPGGESAYVLREGKVYGIRPGADLWTDAGAFTKETEEAEALLEAEPERALQIFERAVDRYEGDYLPDARYEAWTAEEREHLAVWFLRAADQLSSLYLRFERPNEAILLSQRILAQDNCWERAYRHLMQAYGRLGDHGQIARTYQRCRETLMRELEVDPAPETQALYQELVGSG
jgi:DNA-binding SARP family transcriptional activator